MVKITPKIQNQQASLEGNAEGTPDFRLELQVLSKMEELETQITGINCEINAKIYNKSHFLQLSIPEELRAKMICRPNKFSGFRKLFRCKHCGIAFNDGRKLGGHISRAHSLIKQLEIRDLRGTIKMNDCLQIRKQYCPNPEIKQQVAQVKIEHEYHQQASPRKSVPNQGEPNIPQNAQSQ